MDLKQGAAVHTGPSPPGPLPVKVPTGATLGDPCTIMQRSRRPRFQPKLQKRVNAGRTNDPNSYKNGAANFHLWCSQVRLLELQEEEILFLLFVIVKYSLITMEVKLGPFTRSLGRF